MLLEEFKEHLRNCNGYRLGYPYNKGQFKATSSNEKKIWSLMSKKEPHCKTCTCCTREGVKVTFKKSMRALTIFQAELLFAVFFLKRIPSDYAGYDNCIAGKEFIENIESFEVI